MWQALQTNHRRDGWVEEALIETYLEEIASSSWALLLTARERRRPASLASSAGVFFMTIDRWFC
jgi:hypothetical protein